MDIHHVIISEACRYNIPLMYDVLEFIQSHETITLYIVQDRRRRRLKTSLIGKKNVWRHHRFGRGEQTLWRHCPHILKSHGPESVCHIKLSRQQRYCLERAKPRLASCCAMLCAVLCCVVLSCLTSCIKWQNSSSWSTPSWFTSTMLMISSICCSDNSRPRSRNICHRKQSVRLLSSRCRVSCHVFVVSLSLSLSCLVLSY
jgi:hypothetical protein